MSDILLLNEECYDVTKPIHYSPLPCITKSLPDNYKIYTDQDVDYYFESIMNGEYRLKHFNGFPSHWLNGLSNCSYCGMSIDFSTYSYCRECCNNMCNNCFNKLSLQNTEEKNKLNGCRTHTLIPRSLGDILCKYPCEVCKQYIEASESRFVDTKKNYNICLNCSKTDEGKELIIQKNITFHTVMDSLKQRDFGSLLDWKPVIADDEENKILVNLNPESEYYGKICLSAMDDHGRCGYYTIWTNETLDQIIDELIVIHETKQRIDEINDSDNSDNSDDDDIDEPIREMMSKRNMSTNYG